MTVCGHIFPHKLLHDLIITLTSSFCVLGSLSNSLFGRNVDFFLLDDAPNPAREYTDVIHSSSITRIIVNEDI